MSRFRSVKITAIITSPLEGDARPCFLDQMFQCTHLWGVICIHENQKPKKVSLHSQAKQQTKHSQVPIYNY